MELLTNLRDWIVTEYKIEEIGEEVARHHLELNTKRAFQ